MTTKSSSCATNANSNPTPIEPPIATDSNKRVNNFGHVPSVPSQVTMDISLNRIILSCFTGAEWRVKWRIVEDVLVGWARLREPTDGIADVPPWGREDKHEEKRRGGSGAAAASPVTRRSSRSSRRRGRQLTGEWSRASRSSLVRPAFPRLASPSMSFFRNSVAGGCCSTRPSFPRCYHMPICDVYVAIQCVSLRDRELYCARADLLV